MAFIFRLRKFMSPNVIWTQKVIVRHQPTMGFCMSFPAFRNGSSPPGRWECSILDGLRKTIHRTVHDPKSSRFLCARGAFARLSGYKAKLLLCSLHFCSALQGDQFVRFKAFEEVKAMWAVSCLPAFVVCDSSSTMRRFFSDSLSGISWICIANILGLVVKPQDMLNIPRNLHIGTKI